ncbi:MAG: 6-aminohexanoate-cyclic-dimer hydrolase [Acinetobacter bereziniae]|uniref:6-aminohexanoate-cyclic-dimer hydrolase n=1 Tax=Acinetobacter bereziniae TaxID=106648 RepID=A0A833P9N5_ACIBZ|nr:MAG: 6-aminohexanoate-cyclic-dimer hydrolase [Acinetobacter bereziniae]
MKFSEYVQYDGIGLAQLVQNKEIQAHELLEIAIQRAEHTHPQINAIVIPMYEQAVKNVNNHANGPFAGVPFLLKDLHQQYAGVATSFGSKSFKNAQYIANENSEIVNR